MQALLNSFFLVAVSEMGDKTQLLTLVLALRFKAPRQIMAGITLAALLNHGLASTLGEWLSSSVDPHILKYGVAASFFAFALWTLLPDRDEGGLASDKHGAFLTTLVTYFFAEMGDKTQLATMALAAKYQAPVTVTIGTTLGMLFSDGLAIYFGENLTRRIPMRAIRVASALLFALFGAGVVAGFA